MYDWQEQNDQSDGARNRKYLDMLITSKVGVGSEAHSELLRESLKNLSPVLLLIIQVMQFHAWSQKEPKFRALGHNNYSTRKRRDGVSKGTKMFADPLRIIIVLISCAMTTACLISCIPITHIHSKNVISLPQQDRQSQNPKKRTNFNQGLGFKG